MGLISKRVVRSEHFQKERIRLQRHASNSLTWIGGRSGSLKTRSMESGIQDHDDGLARRRQPFLNTDRFTQQTECGMITRMIYNVLVLL